LGDALGELQTRSAPVRKARIARSAG